MRYLLLEEQEEQIIPTLKDDDLNLGEGDVLVEVYYSSLNYKEMLAFDKNSKVIPNYPIVPGIDFCGRVIQGDGKCFRTNDFVLGTGYDLGIRHQGGLSEFIKVPKEWLIKIKKHELRKSMVYGTAGLTAGLSVYQIIKSLPQIDFEVPILVTGATGGVGSIATLILKKLGFKNITALIHNKNKQVILEKMGVTNFIFTDELDNKKPLQKQRFKLVIDTVGGDVLASILPMVCYEGIVTTCGNASGSKLNTTVFPFILRGVSLIGIDSVFVSHNKREMIWRMLFNEWDISDELVVNEIKLDDVIEFVRMMQEGKHSTRTIVKIKE